MKRCSEAGVEPRTLEGSSWEKSSSGFDFGINTFRVGEVILQLEGEHQGENAALAILVAQELKAFFEVSRDNIIDGLERARHPGRLEWFEVGDVRVLLDGAHNLGGAQALAKYLKPWWATGSIALVYGAMNDKDYESILEVLSPLVTDLILTEPTNTRSHSSQEMAVAMRDVLGPSRVFAVRDVSDALDAAVQLAGTYPAIKPSMVLVTGSLYLVGEVRRIVSGDDLRNN